MIDALTSTQIQSWDTNNDTVLDEAETVKFFEDQGVEGVVVEENDGKFDISWGDGDEEFSVVSSDGTGGNSGISAAALIEQIEVEAGDVSNNDGQLEVAEFQGVFGAESELRTYEDANPETAAETSSPSPRMADGKVPKAVRSGLSNGAYPVSAFIKEIDSSDFTIGQLRQEPGYDDVKDRKVTSDEDVRTLLRTVRITDIPSGLLEFFRGMTIEAILAALEDIDNDGDGNGRINDDEELIQLGINSITDISDIRGAFVDGADLTEDHAADIIKQVSNGDDDDAEALAAAIFKAAGIEDGKTIQPHTLGVSLRTLDKSEEGGQQNNGMLDDLSTFVSAGGELTSLAQSRLDLIFTQKIPRGIATQSEASSA